MADEYKPALVIDLQGETRIEHLQLPDGTPLVREVLVPTETLIPLSDDELAQRTAERQEAIAANDVLEAAVVERKALVGKLATGAATSTETQQALAVLLGGEPK